MSEPTRRSEAVCGSKTTKRSKRSVGVLFQSQRRPSSKVRFGLSLKLSCTKRPMASDVMLLLLLPWMTENALTVPALKAATFAKVKVPGSMLKLLLRKRRTSPPNLKAWRPRR
jgi:hypothetical protein